MLALCHDWPHFMGRQTPEIWTSLYITVLYNNRREDGLKCDRTMLSSPWIRSGKFKLGTAFSDVIYYSRFQIVLPYCITERFYLNWPYFMPHSIVTGQGIHKRMVRLQKLTRNLFLILHGHNLHRQQQQMSKFVVRYQQFASHAYCGACFQDGVAARKGFLCAPFWGVQICDYSAAWVSCTV